MTSLRIPEILVVEDNEADMSLLRVLFANCGMKVNLHSAKNGMQGADFIFARGQFSNRPLPDLILMDLNIPEKEGRELMKEIKSNVDFCRIPIVVLSTTSNEWEIADSYLCGAAAFITKPSDLNNYQETITTLCKFWFGCVKLPRQTESWHKRFNQPASVSY